MRTLHCCLLGLALVLFSGCTEMRQEGDAKVFQSSAVGSMIRTFVGLGLIGLGGVAIAGGVLPDRKPKNRTAKPSEKLSSGQRVGLACFGFAMGFMGLFLAGISLLFPSKLHVTVYPDRVAMASTYSQTGGKEVVVPFGNLSSVEIRDEPNVVGKFEKRLVFTLKNGGHVKQNAGNNERQALDTIRQALAEYQANPAAISARPEVVHNDSREVENAVATRPRNPLPGPESATTEKTSAPPPQEYALKRYKINIPVPSDYSIVGPDTVVEVGSKLKACHAGSWSNLTVVAINDDGTITCNWDSYRSYTYRMMREDLIIANPDGALAAVETPPSETPPAASPQYSLKRYVINIPVPEGHAVVDAADEVQVGMKLGACYAGQWESVTVVAVNDDGTISCNWDKWPAFTYKMLREDLTMAK